MLTFLKNYEIRNKLNYFVINNVSNNNIIIRVIFESFIIVDNVNYLSY